MTLIDACTNRHIKNIFHARNKIEITPRQANE